MPPGMFASRRLRREKRVAQLEAAVETGSEEKEEMLLSYRKQVTGARQGVAMATTTCIWRLCAVDA